MTVIIGGVEDGKAYLGADSCVVSGNTLLPPMNKLFWIGDDLRLLMGSSGDVRTDQILESHLLDNGRSVNTIESLVDSIRACLKEYDHLDSDGQLATGYMVACNYGVYIIYSDFSWIDVSEGKLYAIGSGSDFAMGAAYVADGSIKQRITVALETASQYCNGVCPPFNINYVELKP